MKTRIVVPPSVEPVALDEAKLHARVDSDLTDGDSVLETLIQSAREQIEGATDRAFITRTIETTFPRPFERPDLRIPVAPVASVLSVVGVDVDGVETPLDGSEWIAETGTPGVVRPRGSWFGWQAVKVTCEAGYGTASDVPAKAKLAILMLVVLWHEHRLPVGPRSLGELPFTVQSLVAGLRWGNHPR